MKQLSLYFFLLFFSGSINGQTIDFVLPDTLSQNDIIDKSKTYKFLHADYEKVISFTRNCYWTNEETILFVGLSNMKWKVGQINLTYTGRDKSIENIKRKRIRAKNINAKIVQKLFDKVDVSKLMLFDFDSLNCDKKILNDSSVLKKSMTDGCWDSFTLVDKGKVITISSYNPDALNEFVKVEQRSDFIIMRNYFYDFWLENK